MQPIQKMILLINFDGHCMTNKLSLGLTLVIKMLYISI